MKITFRAESKIDYEVCPRPVPTSQYLPEWWRKAKPYEPSPGDPDGKKMKVKGRETTAMMKKCTPMLDLLTAGYIVPLWSDVLVEQDEERQHDRQDHGEGVAQRHGNDTVLADHEVVAKAEEALAAARKKCCGWGGTVRDGRIETQGEHRERIVAELEKLGYKVKRAGG